MNFFEQQARARTSSSRLVVLFAITVLATAGAMGVVTYFIVLLQSEEPALATGLAATGGVAASIATVVVIVLASFYKTLRLGKGGGVVARQVGGTLVSTDTSNPAYRKLRNVVEEIAIASGVPVPEIYVLENETAINAFAAGWSPSDAAIAVTRGAIDQLTRDELQGVVAHEFSHVLNGDMRLNIRLMGVLFGILLLGLLGRHLLDATRGGGRGGKGSGGIALAALALFLIGYTGLFFGRLIKAGVSRQREFLADASAVQFTRQNLGLAGALRKIAGSEHGSKIDTPEVEEVTHMLFGDGVGYSRLFATHPPIDERIARLGKVAIEAKPTTAAAPPRAPQSTPSQPPRAPRGPIAVPDEALAGISSFVGNPAPAHYEHAHDLRLSIPEALRAAAHRQDESAALVLALALDRDVAVRDAQLAAFEAVLGPELRDVALALVPQLDAVPADARLPLAQLAFPALRRRPDTWLARYAEALDRALAADATVSIADYCLARLVRMQVLDTLDPARRRVVGRAKLRDVQGELAVVLATLAKHGHDGEDAARRAYVHGMRDLAGKLPPYLPPRDSVRALDAALAALDRLDAAGKSLVVEALVRVMAHDAKIGVAEAELVRVICASLHCPLPPALPEPA